MSTANSDTLTFLKIFRRDLRLASWSLNDITASNILNLAGVSSDGSGGFVVDISGQHSSLAKGEVGQIDFFGIQDSSRKFGSDESTYPDYDPNNVQITTLNLSNNPQIAGQLPSQLYLFKELKKVSFSKTSASGTLRDEWSKLTALTELDLSDLPSVNSSTSSFPYSWRTLANLQTLRLDNTAVRGELPSSLTSMNALRTFSIANSYVCGRLPSDLPSGLSFFNVSGNYITYEAPASYANYPLTIDISNNNMCGCIPATWSKITYYINAARDAIGMDSCGENTCNSTAMNCRYSFDLPNPGGGDSNSAKKKLSGGAIAGIVIGCIVGVALIVLAIVLIVCCCCRNKSGDEEKDSDNDDDDRPTRSASSRSAGGTTDNETERSFTTGGDTSSEVTQTNDTASYTETASTTSGGTTLTTSTGATGTTGGTTTTGETGTTGFSSLGY